MYKSRSNRRPYRVETLLKKDRIDKRRDHVLKRLRERTSLPDSYLGNLRRRVSEADIPPGTHHLKLKDGYAVIKDVGRTSRKHVVATILHNDMPRRPGQDLTMSFRKQKLAGVLAEAVLSQPQIPTPLANAFRVAYRTDRKQDPQMQALPASMPQDPQFLSMQQTGEQAANEFADTTPTMDLLSGRRLPMSGPDDGGEFGPSDSPMMRLLRQPMNRQAMTL